MKNKLNAFIKNNLEKEINYGRFKAAKMGASSINYEEVCCNDINSFINNNKNESKFQSLLFKYIDYSFKK